MSHAGAPTRREFVAEAASAVLVTTRVPHVAPVPLRDYRQVRVGLLRVASFTTLGALTPTAATGEAMALAVESLHRAGCAVASFEVPDADRIASMMFGLLAADGGAFLSGLLAEAGTTDSPMMAFWGAQKPL